MNRQGQCSAFADAAILEALRTPWIDRGGALATTWIGGGQGMALLIEHPAYRG